MPDLRPESAGHIVSVPGMRSIPKLFAAAGDRAAYALLEYFAARIRNRNTREAYARAVWQFARWCDRKELTLHRIPSIAIAQYVEELGDRLAKPSVKQHLAAIRMLFDFLVVRHVLDVNPAAPVRGPKHIVKRGRTPVLAGHEARQLLDSIDRTTLIGKRDHAIIAVMIYSFARVGALAAMKVEDYRCQGQRAWFRLKEKGGKHYDIPAHTEARASVQAYLLASMPHEGTRTPLFRTIRGGRFTENRMDRREVLAMIKRRALAAGLSPATCCHSFRATGITQYLLAGGTLEKAQQIAGHESPKTTKLYDRTNDDIEAEEIERITL